MADRYARMTDDEFDLILQRLVEENVHSLLSIPGVYEAVSEHFNNDVLEIWEEENPEAEETDEDSDEYDPSSDFDRYHCTADKGDCNCEACRRQGS